MDSILEFARGPLFRLTFALMILGLLRIFVLEIVGMVQAYRRAGDKRIPWGLTIGRTLQWFFPVRRIGNNRPLYSVAAILFHIGLLATPIFLFAHVDLWRNSVGFGWWTLSPDAANWLTIGTIVTGVAIFLGRVGSRKSRAISRKQDYLWPLLLLIPFITGYACANIGIAPGLYRVLMLVHILSGELIFVLLPFTKIAHCALMPFSQMVSVLAWKFPARVDEDVCETLDKKGAPV